MERLHYSNKTLIKYRNNQIKNFVKYLKKAQKKPRPETIHKIRTTIRRLSILMKKKEIKKLMKALGKDRDLHVAKKLAHSFGFSTKNIIQENNAFKKIKNFDFKVLKFTDDSNLLLRYESAMGKLKLKLEAFSSDLLDEKTMHEFRILIKKIRYGLEAIGQSSPLIEEMQEQLGKIHDIDVLQSMKGKRDILEIIKKMMIEDVQRVYQSVYKLMKTKLTGY